MSETAQIILAVGGAIFLAGLIIVTGIWAFRCKSDAPTYRNPLIILGAPTIVAIAYLLHRVI
jgi:hypothetical protein